MPGQFRVNLINKVHFYWVSWNQSNQNSQSEDRYISQGANNIAKKKVQEYASKQVVIHFSFKPGCVKEWREFSEPITKSYNSSKGILEYFRRPI